VPGLGGDGLVLLGGGGESLTAPLQGGDQVLFCCKEYGNRVCMD
jgi:hypothetical protein